MIGFLGRDYDTRAAVRVTGRPFLVSVEFNEAFPEHLVTQFSCFILPSFRLEKRERQSMGSGKAVILVALLLMVSACSQPGANELRRANEWMEIGETENARTEIYALIQEYPQHIEARRLLAESFFMDARSGRNAATNLERALGVMNEVRRIDPDSEVISEIREGSIRVLNEALLRASDYQLRALLNIAEQVHSVETVDPLLMVMGNPDDTLANRALEIVGVIDPDYIVPRLRALADSSDAHVAERSILLLWEQFGEDSARARAAEIYFARLRNSSQLDGARALARLLRRTGVAELGQPLREFIEGNYRNSRIGGGVVAAFELYSSEFPDEADALVGDYLSGTVRSNISARACSNFGLAVQAHLQRNSSERNIEYARALLGLYVLEQSQRSDCRARLEATANALDNQSWHTLRTFYSPGGWAIFTTMIPGHLNDLRGGANPSSYAARRWDLYADPSGEAARRVQRLLAALGPYSAFSGGRRIRFEPYYLGCETPTECRLYMNLVETSRGNTRGVGRLLVRVQSIGSNADQPWVITGVDTAELDGQNLLE
ncbi:hypothetical protein [Hyphobacterium marinum]|uniref:HEAT repeat domain-containing protein n=1 Tax=Hyphobacterium marinum TaxID=3116574 RepID=A0ABU7LZ25_9PROT|nr:hypothetical protein [Hyphobacterium sp. Y6023]MEE2566809.1 hypothetical protein [Hyphobacterium sp. Y6023]